MTTLTTKQTQIMDSILRGNPDGSWMDFDELIAALPYKTTKDSMHFSIRALVKHGLIDKKPLEFRRGQERRVLAPTGRAYEVCRRA